jgi:hypothetical protein
MKKLVSGTASLALMFSVCAPVSFLGLASPAQASSPSQRDCEADGGVWSKDGGHVSCTYTTIDHVGNSDNSQIVENTDTDSSNGTLNNDPHYKTDSKCDGTGNTSSPQDHC